MKHLKLFESFEKEVELFYKDKINWKFFNYLVDMATKWEDRGYTVRIKVSTDDVEYGWGWIYQYNSDEKPEYNSSNVIDYDNPDLMWYTVMIFADIPGGTYRISEENVGIFIKDLMKLNKIEKRENSNLYFRPIENNPLT